MKKYIIIPFLLIVTPGFCDDYKIICQPSTEKLEKIIKEHLKLGWIVNGSPFTLVKSQKEYNGGYDSYSYNPSTTSVCQCLISKSKK